VITGKNVTVEYRGVLKGLSNASFSILDKNITCLLGPNASGKTTLLRAIAKLVEYEGSLLIDGEEVLRIPLGVLSRILSYGSASTISTSLSLKVREILEMALYPVGGAVASREIYEVSNELGILSLLDRNIDELSSGELQRVVIASVLIKKPRYILLDEPDAHVDVGFKPLLSGVLRRRKDSSTIIISTHDPIFASSLCDYLILLKKGAIVFQGRLQDLFQELDLLRDAYGVDFTVVTATPGRKIIVPCY